MVLHNDLIPFEVYSLTLYADGSLYLNGLHYIAIDKIQPGVVWIWLLLVKDILTFFRYFFYSKHAQLNVERYS